MYLIQEILANNLRYFRTKAALSQKALAERCNLSNNYIGLIERGLKWPSPINVEALAQALKIESCQLFLLDPELFRNPKIYLQRYTMDIIEAHDRALGELFQDIPNRKKDPKSG